MLVKIPVVLATLIIHSKEVERINILTKLILHAIALGVNINRIPYVTNLPQRLVSENVEELERRGVIIGDYNGNYSLTDVGRKNFNLLNETEIINERKIEVLVDSYTKHIFRKEEILERYVSDEENEKIKEVVKIEGNRYIKQFLNNLDPSNSKEIVSKILKNIEKEDMENISVEVKMVNEKGGYIVGKVKDNIVKKNQNIDINEIEEIQELKAKYGNDIEFEVKIEKEYVYEKFAIEDVIDIYDKEVEVNG